MAGWEKQAMGFGFLVVLVRRSGGVLWAVSRKGISVI